MENTRLWMRAWTCIHVHVCERECPCVCAGERQRESEEGVVGRVDQTREMLGGSVGSRGPMQPMSAPYRMPCSSLEPRPCRGVGQLALELRVL